MVYLIALDIVPPSPVTSEPYSASYSVIQIPLRNTKQLKLKHWMNQHYTVKDIRVPLVQCVVLVVRVPVSAINKVKIRMN